MRFAHVFPPHWNVHYRLTASFLGTTARHLKFVLKRQQARRTTGAGAAPAPSSGGVDASALASEQELALLRGRVDELESRVTALETLSFSTTTRLRADTRWVLMLELPTAEVMKELDTDDRDLAEAEIRRSDHANASRMHDQFGVINDALLRLGAISAPIAWTANLRAPRIKGEAPADGAGLVERVRWLIESEINPQLASHKGRVALDSIDADGVVYLRFGGGCHGCGMADVTLKQGIEKTMMGRIPEVTAVRDATDHSTGSAPYIARG